MNDLKDGETCEIQGSGKKPYIIKNVANSYSCSCPAWRNQSLPIERRTCKHIRKLRGDKAEEERIGNAVPVAKEEKVTNKPPVLLAQNWDKVSDLTNWYLSEKYDGVRAYWDGRNFISRGGNTFHAPDWFVKELPKIVLDGELWMGRKLFNKTSGIARRQDKSDHWKELKFLVFDAPGNEPFEARMKVLESIYSPYAIIVKHVICKGESHLKEELKRIEELGGEGLMARQPGSKYESGISSTLLKIKSFYDDEGTVIGYTNGKGKHKGKVGSLIVKWKEKELTIGTGLSDEDRSNPPKIGEVITFSYTELNENDIPRFAAYKGIRPSGF